jgi:hypothetical protein
MVSVCLPLHVHVHVHVYETRFAAGINGSSDPLTDGIEVPGDIVFICRLPTVLSVRVVLKSDHSENIET